MKLRTVSASLLAAFALSACDGSVSNDLDPTKPGNGATPGTPPGEPPPPSPPAPPTGPDPRYVGIGGRSLVLDRKPRPAQQDSTRLKPYSALAAEYQRVAGRAPTKLAMNAPTFGVPPARWFEEPRASAVTVITQYGLNFDVCLDITATDAAFQNVPTDTTARTQCAGWARRFWSREATDAELAACVSVASTGSASEAVARRRWAYTCASMLSASGFTCF